MFVVQLAAAELAVISAALTLDPVTAQPRVFSMIGISRLAILVCPCTFGWPLP